MATGTNIRTYFEGRWHDGDVPVMRAADHGMWLGSSVFDGARWFEGVAPDLDLHCERVNRSATALGLKPTMAASEIVALTHEGIAKFDGKTAYERKTSPFLRFSSFIINS